MSICRRGLWWPCVISIAVASLACHQPADQNTNATATTAATPPGEQRLRQVPRPAAIEQAMKERGEQDQAKPVLQIISPAPGATINDSTVEVKLELQGDLKGYLPHRDPATSKGNHIHVILDNQPYEAYYEINQPFELRNLAEGKHTLRVFPSRPWHESYKSDGAFQMVEFNVRHRGDKIANPSATPNGAPPAREGKDFPPSQGGEVDRAKPILTYSRPKGEYKGADADPIMIDFWLLNAKLQGDGGDYRVRYSIDGGAQQFLDKWEPIWLSGWISGKHSVKLELIDKDGNIVDNGGYNATTREITISR